VNITELPIALIDEDTEQPRYQFDEETMQELMNSIEELGLLSPIKVRTTKDGRYKIIYGNRRYKACKTLGRQSIPCIVSDVTDELEIYLEQVAENLTREGFSPIEEAEAFSKLLNDPKYRSSTKFLSSKLGKPENYIKNKCDLLLFGPAVKKLIIRGSEITKDRLTEEQLLPIKELPLEHRDPLALIIARDEMPVSDVKKIARLFKNKDISDNTKDKLLYKSGPGLLETYFTYEQNKAERAKPAQPKPAAKASKPETEQGEQTEHIERPNQSEQTEQHIAASQHSPVELRLLQLLRALPVPAALPSEAAQFIEQLQAADRESILADINNLVEMLEKHLTDWRTLRDQLQ